MESYTKNKKISFEKTIFINRTLRYLIPIFNMFGKKFISYFNEIKWKAYAIGDYNVSDELGNKIYCIAEADYTLFTFIDFLKTQDYFVEEYIFSLKKNLHCLVLDFPRKDIINKFLQGNYSEMLTEEEVDSFYLKYKKDKDGKEHYSSVYSILTKRADYFPYFKENLLSDFGHAEVNQEDIKEYDYPPMLSMETLNCK